MLASDTPVKRRNESVDIVKGMAITLVVFGHALQGLIHRGWWATPNSALLERFIYSFHMPAFFFVSGLFVNRSLVHRKSWGFLTDKLRTILYPYLLWVTIDMAQQPLTASFRSSSISIAPLAYFERALTGEQSWFLHTLFFCMVLTLLTQKLPDWLRALIAVSICLFAPLTGIAGIDNLTREWAFVAIGQLVGKMIMQVDQLNRVYAVLCVGLLAAVQLTGVFYGGYPRLMFLILGSTGTLGLFCLAAAFRSTGTARLIAWTGEASLGIYVLHPYFQGGTRELITRISHTHLALPHLLLTTAVATLLPALIWHKRDQWHIGWLFRWGHERTSNRVRPTPATC